MSYNSKQFLAYHERLLEPDQVTGTRRFRKPPREQFTFPPQPVELSEYERARREDENIERHYSETLKQKI